jgi:catechol 2,3-dioxygenase-like lactoylglutathione lyase family enzyme
MLRRLDNIDITCRDFDEMVAFYHGVLGLPFLQPYDRSSGWAGLRIGSVALYLLEDPEAAKHPGPAELPWVRGLGFEVDDLDEAIAWLDGKGVRWEGDIVVSPWYRYRGFYDPDGNVLYLSLPDKVALGAERW